MSFNIRLISLATIGAVAAALLIGGCANKAASKSQQSTIITKADTAFLTVTGPAAKLKMFDTRLRQLLGLGQQDSGDLGCKNCDKIQQGVTPTPSQLVYIIPRRSNALFQHIGTAWNDVWYDSNDQFNAADGQRLILHLDYNSGPDPVCTGSATPCFPRPTCRLTSYCSQNSTGACLPACNP